MNKQHYTLYSLEDGREAGCATTILPNKVLEILNIRMEPSDSKECNECEDEELEVSHD